MAGENGDIGIGIGPGSSRQKIHAKIPPLPS
jgi:hypothetical protein